MGELKHNVQRTLGVWGITFFFVLVGWLLYSGYVMLWKPQHNPNATTKQQADSITNVENNYPEKKHFIDLKLWVFGITLW